MAGLFKKASSSIDNSTSRFFIAPAYNQALREIEKLKDDFSILLEKFITHYGKEFKAGDITGVVGQKIDIINDQIKKVKQIKNVDVNKYLRTIANNLEYLISYEIVLKKNKAGETVKSEPALNAILGEFISQVEIAQMYQRYRAQLNRIFSLIAEGEKDKNHFQRIFKESGTAGLKSVASGLMPAAANAIFGPFSGITQSVGGFAYSQWQKSLASRYDKEKGTLGGNLSSAVGGGSMDGKGSTGASGVGGSPVSGAGVMAGGMGLFEFFDSPHGAYKAKWTSDLMKILKGQKTTSSSSSTRGSWSETLGLGGLALWFSKWIINPLKTAALWTRRLFTNPIRTLTLLSGRITQFFSSIGSKVTGLFAGIGNVFNRILPLFTKLGGILKFLGSFIGPVIGVIGTAMSAWDIGRWFGKNVKVGGKSIDDNLSGSNGLFTNAITSHEAQKGTPYQVFEKTFANRPTYSNQNMTMDDVGSLAAAQRQAEDARIDRMTKEILKASKESNTQSTAQVSKKREQYKNVSDPGMDFINMGLMGSSM